MARNCQKKNIKYVKGNKGTYGQQTIVNCMKIILYNTRVLHITTKTLKTVLLCKHFILQIKHI